MEGPRSDDVRTTVLVEGRSDAVAVRVLAAARGLATPERPVEILDMGGATNVDQHLRRLAELNPSVWVAGLCDAAEERFFIRALQRQGASVQSREDLGRLGFYVCDPDLEAEFLRALGAEVVAQALCDLGDGQRFKSFQRQIEWRDRPLADQLHRFAGTGSGRKTRLAEHLARQLTPGTTPAPLAALIDFVAQVSSLGHESEPRPQT